VKPLARWSLRQLGRTRLFQSKPLLAPLLRTLWRYLRAGTPQAGEAAVQALSLGRPAAYPILFHDRHGLEYLLYPGQNAEVYLASNGNYEIGETEFCLAHLGPGMTAFDVGAHIGLYTLLFASRVGPAGCVHAFEPEPRNYRRLRINLAINGFDNVAARQAAVVARTQPVTLNVYPDAFHAWHSLGRAAMPDPRQPGKTVEPECQVEVPGVSLDDYCAEHGVRRIDYLKIDVEGAELDVLQGARRLLAEQAVGLIQFEASPAPLAGQPGGRDEVFALLSAAGFRCHPIEASGALGGETRTARADRANYAAVRP
jgi:FkbM family methyltransferase